jgi:hypothetical protein
MGSQRRKLVVGAASFAAVFAAYLLYVSVSGSGRIDTASTRQPLESPPAAVTETGRIGAVGEVGVEDVQKAVFTELDDNKRIEREFGFNRLLHKEGQMWDLEGPYMNIYRDGFDSYIQARKGNAMVEEILGRPRLKEITLAGDVVVRLVPRGAEKEEESRLYLDDVTFVEGESRFFTAGDVRFVSADAELTGRGLEVVYNDEADRLELLRVTDLHSLRLKNVDDEKPGVPGGAAEEKPAPGGGAETAGRPPMPSVAVEKGPDQLYRCVLGGHVLVESPGQVVLAESLSINRLLLKTKHGAVAPADGRPEVAVSDRSQHAAGPVDTGPGDPNQAPPLAASHGEVVVTCRRGLLVTSMEDARSQAAETADAALWERAESLAAAGGTVLAADRIDVDYHGSLGDIAATGRSRLSFFVDMNSPSGTEAAVPVSVTAAKAVTYSPAANSVLFEGDCLSTMTRTRKAGQSRYTLAAPRLLVDLSAGNGVSDRSLGGIRHATADGGGVRLETVDTVNGQFAGGSKLKCRRFDYDGLEQSVLATGNGVIAVDNSRPGEDAASGGRSSLKGPFYAVVRNFDRLEYLLGPRRLLAASEEERMLIDYFTVAGGEYARQVFVTSRSVDADFSGSETAELAGLKAAGGVSYEEEGVQFEGSEFVYDAAASTITAAGSGEYPAYCNGALVDAVRYDLETGRIRTSIRGPGQLEAK